MDSINDIIDYIIENQILCAVIAVLILLIILYLCSYFSKGNRKGRAAEKKVANALRKVSRKDKVHIMNNVYLPLYKKACEIDHLVIGKFGILVIETKGVSGEITGSGEFLTHKIGRNTHTFRNPQYQNKTHMDNVVHHLKKGRFYDIPVKGAVVFAAKDVTYPKGVGMDIETLKKFYQSQHNAGVDPDVIYDYIRSIRVHDPLKKLSVRHRANRD